MNITEHFKESELQCKCGCGKSIIIYQLAYGLEVLRRLIKKPIIITSAYRCPTHNANVGGVSNSQHKTGKACDIQVPGMAPYDVYQCAKFIFDGIGIYDDFLHVDIRTYLDYRYSKAYWDKRTNKNILPDGPSNNEINNILKDTE